jgi:hypothetical protein
MQEWKIKQEIYHRIYYSPIDDLNNIKIVYGEENIKETALRHFFERIDDFLYPAKSYVVAFCYAYWISQTYNEDFWELLKDPKLLYDNDPYFKTYDEDPEIYDFLFDHVDWPIPMKGMIPDIRKYYDAEIGFE